MPPDARAPRRSPASHVAPAPGVELAPTGRAEDALGQDHSFRRPTRVDAGRCASGRQHGIVRTESCSHAMIEAVLFDVDGVITETARVHAVAWKRAFDELLERRARRSGEPFRPFDAGSDYRHFVDGRPREDGVRRFLESRGVTLPTGSERDGPDAETVHGLATRKNRHFLDWLDHHRVQAFAGSVRLVGELRRAGVRTAVFSASRNAGAVLRSAGVTDLFDEVFAGDEAARLDLPGKPDPATLEEAARRLGVPPARAAVVEDATAGIEAAVRGGFGLAVGIDRGNAADALWAAGAHVVVHDLAEMTWRPSDGLVVRRLSTLPRAVDRGDELRERLAGKVPAVFLDYDGTLTPIVEDFTRAFLSDGMRAAVRALAARCTVAVVSGRDVQAVRRLVAVESAYYMGSHGFDIQGPEGWNESLQKGVEILPQLDDAERRLRQMLAGVAGHAVERQRFSIAVHYRQASRADVARIESAVERVVDAHPDLWKGHGKKVFRVQPAIAWDKGRAVLWLLERLDLDRPGVVPVYLGDDITDEDAFQALAGRGICLVVRGEEDRPTAADFALADPGEVRRFLQLLTEAAGDGPDRTRA